MLRTAPAVVGTATSCARPLARTALLKDFEPGAGLAAGAARTDGDAEDWLTVPVPGDVHSALVTHGRLAHPFFDRNEREAGWIEEREWWYRIRFDAPAPAEPHERIRLVFAGLDTYASAYLNGQLLGTHENMFRPVSFDVTERLRLDGENLVAVRFDPPMFHAGPPLPDQWAPNDHARVWMRKAQFGYGWDWGPRLPTVGIWRPVELRRERRAAIAAVRFATQRVDPGGREAAVEVEVKAEQFGAAAELETTITLQPPGGGRPVETRMLLNDGSARISLVLEQPELWWTHDLGDPALYELTVRLLADGEEVEEQHRHVGVRTIELDQRPDPEEPGTRFFRFVLNGRPLFARGANWIPLDSFVGAIPEERYERRIEAAREANMNMLRVWGGGIYEHDAFYGLCDTLGVLVWQDFMFACAAYPGAELAAEVEREARYQVLRLRNHPSLALWCGNNECQWIHDREHPERGGERVPGAVLYDEVLPRVVAELAGAIPYWPGSPYGGSDHNAREDGDVHNWEVWHGNYPRRFGEPARREPTPESVSYRRYAEDTGRFISEFGVLSAPHRETLRRWIPSEQRWHHSPAIDHHTKDTPKNKVDMLLESVTGVAGELEEFVEFSMIAQAEALKFGVEHYRRRMPHCSGALVWQLNDCWPGLSWSVIDYHGFKKAAYYFLRRAFAPVLASFRDGAGGELELWIVNDSRWNLDDVARVRFGQFDGADVREQEVPVGVPANASTCVARWPTVEPAGGPNGYAVVSSSTAAFPTNRHFFAAIKDLRRTRPRVEMQAQAVTERELSVRLRADAYAYFIELDTADERVWFEDNFIELEPGEERVLSVEHPVAELSVGDLALRWR